jgi:uncharacterized protein
VPNLVEKKKIVRDVVHGYIELTKNDISLIDTPRFQRLKRIHQTGASSVYPCANHTRFEHSIGVMHLGSNVFEVLKKQDARIDNVKFQNTVRYACLFHDIGHAPFSHLGEFFYDKDELKTKVHAELKRLKIDNTFNGENAAKHELCSCAIALEYYSDLLLLYEVDLDLFCRMITGETYGPGVNDIANCLIEILNSDIDVDKLDYILRDSYMSGAKLVTLDIDRIINSYVIYRNALAFSGQSLSTISNLIFGRDALYVWVYNHHITVYTDCLFKRLIDRVIKNNVGLGNYFSYKAISKDLIDDHDLISFIRTEVKKDDYCKILYDQLFNRNFFKSIWKNPFEFDLLIPDPAYRDTFIQSVGLQKQNLENLENSIIAKTPELTAGDFFISFAYFKPYTPIAGKSIYLLMKDQRKTFQEIFQEGIFKTKRTDLPFIFVKDDHVKGILLKKLNEGTFN